MKFITVVKNTKIWKKKSKNAGRCVNSRTTQILYNVLSRQNIEITADILQESYLSRNPSTATQIYFHQISLLEYISFESFVRIYCHLSGWKLPRLYLNLNKESHNLLFTLKFYEQVDLDVTGRCNMYYESFFSKQVFFILFIFNHLVFFQNEEIFI